MLRVHDMFSSFRRSGGPNRRCATAAIVTEAKSGIKLRAVQGATYDDAVELQGDLHAKPARQPSRQIAPDSP